MHAHASVVHRDDRACKQILARSLQDRNNHSLDVPRINIGNAEVDQRRFDGPANREHRAEVLIATHKYRMLPFGFGEYLGVRRPGVHELAYARDIDPP
jgi:hypothetical protein